VCVCVCVREREREREREMGMQDRVGLDGDKTVFEIINNGYDIMELGAREVLYDSTRL
jgi:hypothetical protein